jgi:cytochrome P450
MERSQKRLLGGARARLSSVRRRWPVAVVLLRSWIRALARARRLPPGRLDPLDREMHADQHYCLKKAGRLGPVFKTWWIDGYVTCIVGHQRARRLLLSNEDHLPGGTLDLRELFPLGAVRAMTGDDHRKYRRLLVQALHGISFEAHEPAIRELIHAGLLALAQSHSGLAVPRQALRASLRATAACIMLRVLFGVVHATPELEGLVACYRRFGPEWPPSQVGPAQAEAFADIRDRLLAIAQDIRGGAAARRPPSLLGHLVGAGELDDTVLGNLIYMFESAHHDLYSLWHWILKQLASHPHVSERMYDAAAQGATCRGRLTEAIVLETLRLEQSEVLYRVATRDIAFERFVIPEQTVVRACIWEGHKDHRVFPDPFKFDPDRFLGRTYDIDEFAPFGMDKRRCIAADFVVRVSAIFVDIVTTKLRLKLLADGPARRGAYHWEPACELSIVARADAGMRSAANVQA